MTVVINLGSRHYYVCLEMTTSVMIFRSLTWLMAIYLVACAPRIAVHSDYDNKVDFHGYRTFAFSDAQDPYDPAFPMYDNELNRQRVQEAIHRQMLARGFSYLEHDPDIMVDFHIVIKERTSLDTYHPDGGRFWRTFEVEVYDYTEGTMVVHLVDNLNKKLVWQGSAVSLLRPHATNPQERIDKATALIFETYPTL